MIEHDRKTFSPQQTQSLTGLRRNTKKLSRLEMFFSSPMYHGKTFFSIARMKGLRDETKEKGREERSRQTRNGDWLFCHIIGFSFEDQSVVSNRLKFSHGKTLVLSRVLPCETQDEFVLATGFFFCMGNGLFP